MFILGPPNLKKEELESNIIKNLKSEVPEIGEKEVAIIKNIIDNGIKEEESLPVREIASLSLESREVGDAWFPELRDVWFPEKYKKHAIKRRNLPMKGRFWTLSVE